MKPLPLSSHPQGPSLGELSENTPNLKHVMSMTAFIELLNVNCFHSKIKYLSKYLLVIFLSDICRHAKFFKYTGFETSLPAL